LVWQNGLLRCAVKELGHEWITTPQHRQIPLLEKIRVMTSHWKKNLILFQLIARKFYSNAAHALLL
jgi:hypothetical protein